MTGATSSAKENNMHESESTIELQDQAGAIKSK